jgi:hypothetical protein
LRSADQTDQKIRFGETDQLIANSKTTKDTRIITQTHLMSAFEDGVLLPSFGASRSTLGASFRGCSPHAFSSPDAKELHMSAPLPSAVSALAFTGITLLVGCASAPLTPGSSLSSQAELSQSDGMITKSRLRVNKQAVLAAKTVSILPTTFSPSAAPKLTDKQRALVANAVSRAMCISLSDRFQVVSMDTPADLTVRTVVTHATETNEVAAGVSAAANIGSSFIDVGVPVPVPRLPIGLGSLNIEAEAFDRDGRQQAAMVWGRGATVLFSSPKASKASDAYDLSSNFGDDFAKLLVKGKSPFGGFDPSLPSLQKINSTIGLKPKYAACEVFGRAPGLGGFLGDQLGLPPEWTDKGGKPSAPL